MPIDKEIEDMVNKYLDLHFDIQKTTHKEGNSYQITIHGDSVFIELSIGESEFQELKTKMIEIEKEKKGELNANKI